MTDHASAIKILDALAVEGRTFTYENFASFGSSGYPNTFAGAFAAWRTRVENLVRKSFVPGAGVISRLATGLNVRSLGNGSDKFDEMMEELLATIAEAKTALADDRFAETLHSDAAAGIDQPISGRVFIVHGHDSGAKDAIERFISEIGLIPVVLHREPDEGMTIIEKFERHSDVGYVIVILTPDEVAYLADKDMLSDDLRNKEWRARPNVIFEFGYFVGSLGRSRVCCLYRGDVTLPTDVSGILYKKFENSPTEIAYDLLRELKAAGLTVTV